MTDFLKSFAFGGIIAICIPPDGAKPTPAHTKYIISEDVSTIEIPDDRDVFFGPAMRQSFGTEKKDVYGSIALWVDADDPQRPLFTLPPSYMVFSGHGWHLYWLLTEPVLDVELLEELNKIVTEDVPTADKACWNANRILRVPGTLNRKEEPHVRCEVRVSRPTIRYSIADIRVVASLDNKARHKIRTGDSRGYRSRSERDWAIVTALVSAGASDDLITRLFALQPCGDKAQENDHYLPQTIEKVREKVQAQERDGITSFTPHAEEVSSEIKEDDEGYYIGTKRGVRRLSTFVIVPQLLLDGSKFNGEDAIVSQVKAAGYTWDGKTFSRQAFTTVSRFDKEAPVMAWQWLAHDDDLRALLPYLLDKLRAVGLPKIAATPMMGLHKLSDKWFFVGDKEVLDGAQVWEGFSGPIAWLPAQKEHPQLDLHAVCSKKELEFIATSVPLLNRETSIWPMIGWYSASCLKPWIEQHNLRFPILNVAGTKGSGKTTLIQRVFLPLFGQTDPKTYDSGTTRFVTLALLGSSNAIPIAFSEFRYELVERFLRFVLLAYDTGHDPRGKGDQTTVDYPLAAPFSVDGEDLIEDPAARERIVVAQLHPHDIDEESEGYKTFQQLRNNLPHGFGGHFIQSTLALMPELEGMLEGARAEVFRCFPAKLPDRVRNNHIVTYFGMTLWCRITGTPLPEPTVLQGSIESVYNLKSGRAPTLADGMVEDIVNASVAGTMNFNHVYDQANGILWFQLAPAHSWWITSRRRQGRGALERDAIRAQLKEAPYSEQPQALNDTWMYGINLARAAEVGLDVPSKLPDRSFVVRF